MKTVSITLRLENNQICLTREQPEQKREIVVTISADRLAYDYRSNGGRAQGGHGVEIDDKLWAVLYEAALRLVDGDK